MVLVEMVGKEEQSLPVVALQSHFAKVLQMLQDKSDYTVVQWLVSPGVNW